MKILYLAPDWGLRLDGTGGGGTHMRGTIKGFKHYGHEVLPVIGGDCMLKSTGVDIGKEIIHNTGKLNKIISSENKIRLLARDIRYWYRGYKLYKKMLPEIIEWFNGQD